MLGKLLKYELKATARTFLPLYGAIIILALVNKAFLSFEFEYGMLIGFLTLFGLFIALVVVTLVLTVTRFYKNLLSSEGYLMFTLPVSADQLIWSKLLVTLLWMAASCAIGVVTFVVLLWQTSIPWQDVLNTVKEVFQAAVDGNYMGVIVQFIVAFLLSALGSILMIYASLAIGQLPPFSNNRVAAAVVAFILINIAVNILELILVFGLGITIDTPAINSNLGMRILTGANILSFIEAVAFYFVTRIILKKHLNLA